MRPPLFCGNFLNKEALDRAKLILALTKHIKCATIANQYVKNSARQKYFTEQRKGDCVQSLSGCSVLF